jgi:hypothetical protein
MSYNQALAKKFYKKRKRRKTVIFLHFSQSVGKAFANKLLSCIIFIEECKAAWLLHQNNAKRGTIMRIYESYYQTLYSRPVVRLAGYSAKYGLPGTLYSYLAYGGATGSAKDALAEGMLAIATEKGLLKPGQTPARTAAIRLCCACRPLCPPSVSICWPSWAPRLLLQITFMAAPV